MIPDLAQNLLSELKFVNVPSDVETNSSAAFEDILLEASISMDVADLSSEGSALLPSVSVDGEMAEEAAEAELQNDSKQKFRAQVSEIEAVSSEQRQPQVNECLTSLGLLHVAPEPMIDPIGAMQEAGQDLNDAIGLHSSEPEFRPNPNAENAERPFRAPSGEDTLDHVAQASIQPGNAEASSDTFIAEPNTKLGFVSEGVGPPQCQAGTPKQHEVQQRELGVDHEALRQSPSNNFTFVAPRAEAGVSYRADSQPRMLEGTLLHRGGTGMLLSESLYQNSGDSAQAPTEEKPWRYRSDGEKQAQTDRSVHQNQPSPRITALEHSEYLEMSAEPASQHEKNHSVASITTPDAPSDLTDLARAQSVAPNYVTTSPVQITHPVVDNSTSAVKISLTAHQVTEIIEVAIQSEMNGEIEIELRPLDLGRMKLTFKQEAQGLAVVVEAERPETVEQIKRHLEQLSTAEAAPRFRFEQNSFGQNARDGQSAQRQNRSSRSESYSDQSTENTSIYPATSVSDLVSGNVDIRA